MSRRLEAGDVASFGERWGLRVEERLRKILEEACRPPDCPPDLAAAMRYAVLGGGKRLRPLCTLAACRVCGGKTAKALDAGCAVELVHCYSLVHDDLPALDDDDVRRGRPSCHRAFGEALAILAGDALLTLGFGVLARAFPPSRASRAVELLSAAAGPQGMVGGQADDIRPWRGKLRIEQVESSHRRKTAALFQAAFGLGALVAGARAPARRALALFGLHLGLAFQIADDLLAASGDRRRLGRPTDSDLRRRRPVHPRAAGELGSQRRAEELLQLANAELAFFGERATLLRSFTHLVRRRLPVVEGSGS